MTEDGAATIATKPFLTAEWRWLVMLNYVIPRELVEPFTPPGMELDEWKGNAIASMVGFRFLRTRVCGWAVPFHQDFDEVNLRFYVRRQVGKEWRRGVVFIKEIVPRRAIAAVARGVYNERYLAMPMRHRLPAQPENGGRFEFAWKAAGSWSQLAAETAGELAIIAPRSEEEFIFEHYWGYSHQRDGTTLEYAVEHPRWRAWQVKSATLEGDISLIYGSAFAQALAQPPPSAFVGEGSAVIVRRGTALGP